MGIDNNSFSPYSNGTTEDSCFMRCRTNHEISVCRLICCKKKYSAFFTGDLDSAAKMYELSQDFPLGSTGKSVTILCFSLSPVCFHSCRFAFAFAGRLTGSIVSMFIDGLIGFFFARKHLEDETKWTNLGLDAIQTLRKWVKSSDWNFSNKLYLLEAEFYFLREDDERALVCYHASIKASKEHRFIHEQGLAEEKLGTYFLNQSRHDDAIIHFENAKKCYEVWGAHAVAQRVDKAIAMLLPFCAARGL